METGVRGAERPAVQILSSPENVAQAAARLVIDSAKTAIAERGAFQLVLSGGRTPVALYRLLGAPSTRSAIDWTRVHLFWADERCVPPDHEDSNYRLVRETLLTQVTIPPAQVHRIRGEEGPDAAAIAYELELRELFPKGDPVFDLILLGVGRDGHTASLFPGDALEQHPARLAVPVLRTAGHSRVSLTLAVLNAGRMAVILATGAEKARIVAAVLHGERQDCPAARVRPGSGGMLWLLDRDAAAVVR